MCIYICIHVFVYIHEYRIFRPAAGAKRIAATGPRWSLYFLPSGIYFFVFVACVSVYHTRRAFLSVCRLDDDCFYYHSWRNNVVIVFGVLSSFVV